MSWCEKGKPAVGRFEKLKLTGVRGVFFEREKRMETGCGMKG